MPVWVIPALVVVVVVSLLLWWLLDRSDKRKRDELELRRAERDATAARVPAERVRRRRSDPWAQIDTEAVREAVSRAGVVSGGGFVLGEAPDWAPPSVWNTGGEEELAEVVEFPIGGKGSGIRGFKHDRSWVDEAVQFREELRARVEVSREETEMTDQAVEPHRVHPPVEMEYRMTRVRELEAALVAAETVNAALRREVDASRGTIERQRAKIADLTGDGE